MTENPQGSLFHSLEEFFYEICVLIVFYPWYLIRFLFAFRPTMADYLQKMRTGKRDAELVSPPVFLMISAVVGTLLFPSQLDEAGARMFAAFAELFVGNKLYVRVAQTAIPLLIVALANALLIEWLTPGGVTRDTFRLPLWSSLLVAGVTLMLMQWTNMIMDLALKPHARIELSIVALVGALISIGWYIWAQACLYTLLTKRKWRIGAIAAFTALAASEAIGQALALVPTIK